MFRTSYPRYLCNNDRPVLTSVQMPPATLSTVVSSTLLPTYGTPQRLSLIHLKVDTHFAVFNATFFLSWGTAGTLVTGPIVDLLVRSGTTQACAYRVSFYAAAALVIVGIAVLALVSRMKQPQVET